MEQNAILLKFVCSIDLFFGIRKIRGKNARNKGEIFPPCIGY
jgi:hypothetical protein